MTTTQTTISNNNDAILAVVAIVIDIVLRKGFAIANHKEILGLKVGCCFRFFQQFLLHSEHVIIPRVDE